MADNRLPDLDDEAIGCGGDPSSRSYACPVLCKRHAKVPYGDNERIMLEEARKDAIAMLEEAGCTDIVSDDVD